MISSKIYVVFGFSTISWLARNKSDSSDIRSKTKIFFSYCIKDCISKRK